MKALVYVGALVFATAVRGAVVYTPGTGHFAERDPFMLGLIRNIDVDGDGQRDFYAADTGGGNGLTLVPIGANQILATREIPPELGRKILEITRGDDIDSTPILGAYIGIEESYGFGDTGGSFIYYCNGRGPVGEPPECAFSFNPWDEDGVSYFGFRMWKNSQPYYGWLAVSLPIYGPSHDIYLNGWAYETEPGVGIIAGQIPEPSTALLAAASLIGCLVRRRRSA